RGVSAGAEPELGAVPGGLGVRDRGAERAEARAVRLLCLRVCDARSERVGAVRCVQRDSGAVYAERGGVWADYGRVVLIVDRRQGVRSQGSGVSRTKAKRCRLPDRCSDLFLRSPSWRFIF